MPSRSLCRHLRSLCRRHHLPRLLHHPCHAPCVATASGGRAFGSRLPHAAAAARAAARMRTISRQLSIATATIPPIATDRPARASLMAAFAEAAVLLRATKCALPPRCIRIRRRRPRHRRHQWYSMRHSVLKPNGGAVPLSSVNGPAPGVTQPRYGTFAAGGIHHGARMRAPTCNAIPSSTT